MPDGLIDGDDLSGVMLVLVLVVLSLLFRLCCCCCCCCCCCLGCCHFVCCEACCWAYGSFQLRLAPQGLPACPHICIFFSMGIHIFSMGVFFYFFLVPTSDFIAYVNPFRELLCACLNLTV